MFPPPHRFDGEWYVGWLRGSDQQGIGIHGVKRIGNRGKAPIGWQAQLLAGCGQGWLMSVNPRHGLDLLARGRQGILFPVLTPHRESYVYELHPGRHRTDLPSTTTGLRRFQKVHGTPKLPNPRRPEYHLLS
jgi:hypothetical protein